MSEPSAGKRRPVTVRIARWSATHPGRAIAVWLSFVVLCLAVGQFTGTRTMSSLDASVGQSQRADAMLHDAHMAEPAVEDVLITARQGRLDGATAHRAASTLRAGMGALPEVAHTDAPIASEAGHALLVEVTMRGDPDDAADHVTPLLRVTSDVQHAYPRLRIEQVGAASLDAAVRDQVAADLGTAANISLPITLLILLIAFGAIIAAGVPVLLALAAVGSATGLSALVSHVIPDSGSTSSMILLMGMAVGVDYSLFYVKRARAERHRGRTHLDAIEVAAETSGHSVLVSGLAVLVSMTGLFLSGYTVFSSLAAGSIIVVAVAVISSLTVLPALLVKLGRGIERPRVPLLWRWSAPRPDGGGGRLWSALLRPALTRPGRTLMISVLVLGALAVPTLSLRLQSDTAESLPASIPATQTLHRLTAAFPGEHATHQVVVRAPSAAAAEVRTALAGLAREVRDDPRFAGSAQMQVSAGGRVHSLKLDVPFDPESAQARAGLVQLRDRLLPAAMDAVPDARWAVTGDTARSVDVDQRLSAALPWVIGFVVLLTMLIMGWVFRSVVIALASALVNLLSVGAAFGVLVLTFQHSWAEGLLGFHSTGAVINWVPLFCFAVLFGLSMDYHVFVVGHIREAVDEGLPMRDAVRAGITRSAGTVTSAAIVMVSVFAIFASLHMIEMKQMGVGLAVAVLLDALVVRVVVLPSLLALLGRRAWWPGGRAASPDHPATRDDQAPRPALERLRA